MDNYIKYLEEGTSRLLEILSQMDMDKEASEAIITAYTDELYSGVCSVDNMPEYEPLIYGRVLKYTDTQLSEVLLSSSLSAEAASKAISLCDKEESLLKLFGEKGWQLPAVNYNNIEQCKQCRDLIYKRKESTSIKAKMVEEDNRINVLLKQAESSLDLSLCSTIEGILSELDADIAICRQKSIELPNISNVDIQNTQRKIDGIKLSAVEKDNLYKRIIDGDNNIDIAVTKQIVSSNDCQDLISLCRSQQQLIEECGSKGWPLPSVKCSDPRTVISMYSHYQDMLKMDGVLASQFNDLTASKQYKEFISNCEKQKKNVEICNRNGWKIPRLSMGDPSALLDKVNVDKRKKETANKKKHILICVAVSLVLVLAIVFGGIVKYREGKVQIPVDVSYAVGMEYTDLKDIFEDAGFENVRVVPDEKGWEESGTVKAVLIDGKDTFKKDAYVKPDMIVEIRFSSLGRVDISQYLEDWKNREYGDVKTVLQNNGFTDISLNPIDTFDKTQDKLVFGLTLNRKEYNSGRCYLPKKAPIEISYYTLKISIGSSNAQYIGLDYKSVVDSLKKNGFTNVQTEEVKTGWAKPNSVVSVMINNSSSFEVGQIYDPGVRIVVKYSSNDRVDATNYFKDWKTSNYSTVQKALTSAGFNNVIVMSKNTTAKAQNQMIAGLTIKGEAYTEGDCFLQKSAPIVIEYYNLKITPGKAANDYTPNTAGYYSTVVSELKTLGFTNIKVYRENDLITGLLNKEGSVDSISIAGKDSFTATDSFNYDSEIVILVHTFEGKGCEDITLISN